MTPADKTLFDELSREFQNAFPQEKATIAVFAPGRVNLIGEHVDYNDGFVFPMAIPLGTMIIGQEIDKNQKSFLKTLSKDVDEPKFIEIDSNQTLSPVKTPKWANYVLGVLAIFLERFEPKENKSFRLLISTSVPIGGGLSSSASVEVAMCTFLEQLYPEFQLTKVDKALLCCQAERTYANVPCGIMDQYTACMAEKDHALLIDCRDKTSKLVPMKDQQVCVLVTNSNVKHELVAGTYAERVKSCHEAAKILGQKSLREVSSIDELESVRNQMTKTVFQRARHAISEIGRTEAAAQALNNNDYEEFGRLMYQSHESLRDDFEVSCEELDQLVDLARSVDGVYGSRMTGGGFGGCTVTLVKKSAVDNCIETMKKGYNGRATFYQFEPSDGARAIVL